MNKLLSHYGVMVHKPVNQSQECMLSKSHLEIQRKNYLTSWYSFHRSFRLLMIYYGMPVWLTAFDTSVIAKQIETK